MIQHWFSACRQICFLTAGCLCHFLVAANNNKSALTLPMLPSSNLNSLECARRSDTDDISDCHITIKNCVSKPCQWVSRVWSGLTALSHTFVRQNVGHEKTFNTNLSFTFLLADNKLYGTAANKSLIWWSKKRFLFYPGHGTEFFHFLLCVSHQTSSSRMLPGLVSKWWSMASHITLQAPFLFLIFMVYAVLWKMSICQESYQ